MARIQAILPSQEIYKQIYGKYTENFGFLQRYGFSSCTIRKTLVFAKENPLWLGAHSGFIQFSYSLVLLEDYSKSLLILRLRNMFARNVVIRFL